MLNNQCTLRFLSGLRRRISTRLPTALFSPRSFTTAHSAVRYANANALRLSRLYSTSQVAMPKRKREPVGARKMSTVAEGVRSRDEVEGVGVEGVGVEGFEVVDGELARAASPDSVLSELSELEDLPEEVEEVEKVAVKKGRRAKKAATAVGKGSKKKAVVPGEEEDYAEEAEVKPKRTRKKAAPKTGSDTEELDEPPRVVINSPLLPLPWTGRLGYACLNTYLRSSRPPIFCSRTCRISTILSHGPDGLKYVQGLGLANARDLKTLILWNEKYNIRFLRISSEMFPFASHPVYGYDLSFAEEPLREAGELAMKLGHRLSVHPGQFTQLGSPRSEVVENAIRDIEYQCQLLRLLHLTGQSDRDAVMVLHMGGVFGSKPDTLDRFRVNYTTRLSADAKRRIVLENDDVAWSVHDLLPICEELDIPLVLDWHHHNIIHDESLREGTQDVLPLLPRIEGTWRRKGVSQKMHYSEAGGVGRMRRRHSKRVKTLPPCGAGMDLMVEAKDKEQAVFELMRKFELPGYKKIGDVIPHERDDENPEVKPKAKLCSSWPFRS